MLHIYVTISLVILCLLNILVRIFLFHVTAAGQQSSGLFLLCYHIKVISWRTAEPAWQPGAAYQLWRMVKSHPTDADPAAARALVKALEADDAEACCRALLRLCAQRLREQKPLPGFLAPWLGRALQAAGKPLQ